MRGTFANVRLRNLLVPGDRGRRSRAICPSGETMTIYDAAMRYREQGVPLVLLAGKEYGTGSSRDWAAKGPLLLGVRAAIAESYERIHRSNLVGMGIAPLQYQSGESAASLGLTGEEIFDVIGLARAAEGAREVLRHGAPRRRLGQGVHGRAPARHPAGGALLPARRHPQLRPPSARRCVVKRAW